MPNMVLMPWKSEVAGIASLFMGGVATGRAWASFIFGDTPVKGRLPIMMPETAYDIIEITQQPEVNYTEGLLTSYRSPRLKARRYSDARQSGSCTAAACVLVTVKNTGNAPGEEVVQAYVHFPEPTGGDAKALKGFVRTQELKRWDASS
eukprot:Skav225922  [mRNA]  locus=scaffold1500:257223:261939:- [translate_table: standard]